MKKVLVILISCFIIAGLTVGCTQIANQLPVGNATEEIANSLTNVADGGFSRTQAFELLPAELVHSADFENIGFDKSQVVFHGGEFEGTQISSGVNANFSYFRMDASSPLIAKAMVYCSNNGETLKSTLTNVASGINDLPTINSNIETLCITNNAQPCCAVIIVDK